MVKEGNSIRVAPPRAQPAPHSSPSACLIVFLALLGGTGAFAEAAKAPGDAEALKRAIHEAAVASNRGAMPALERRLEELERSRDRDADPAMFAGAHDELAALCWRWKDEKPFADKSLDHWRRSLAIRLAAGDADAAAVVTAVDRLAEGLRALGREQEAVGAWTAHIARVEKLRGRNSVAFTDALSRLGWLHKNLKQFGPAEALLKEALSIRTGITGPESHDVGRALRNLAFLHRDMGKDDLFARELGEAARLMEQHGKYSAVLDGALTELAAWHDRAGNRAEVAAVWRRIAALRLAALGVDNRDAILAQNNLASELRRQGDLKGAAAILDSLLPGVISKLGGGDPGTAVCLNNVALLRKAQGRAAEACELMEMALSIRLGLLKSPHDVLRRTHSNLAECLMAAGKPREAAGHFEETLRQTVAIEGGDSDHAWNDLIQAGDAWRATGEKEKSDEAFAKALAHFEEGLRLAERGAATPSKKIATSLNRVGWCLYLMKHYPRAEGVMKRELEVARAVYGPASLSVSWPLRNLGLLCRKVDRPAEVEDYLKRAIEIRRKVERRPSEDTIWTMDALAEFFEKAGRNEDALPWFREAAAAAEKAGDNPERLAKQLNDLGWLLYRMGRLEEGQPILERCLAIRTGHFGRNHSETAWAQRNLGRLLEKRGDFAAAEKHYREAVSILLPLKGAAHKDAVSFQNDLVDTLVGQGRHDEALALSRDSTAALERSGLAGDLLLKQQGRLMSVLWKIGRIAEAGAEAEAFLRKHPAEAIRDFQTASLLTAMAGYARAVGGDVGKARRLAEQAVALWDKAGPGADPAYGVTINAIAMMISDRLGDRAMNDAVAARMAAALPSIKTGTGDVNADFALALGLLNSGSGSAGEFGKVAAAFIERHRSSPDSQVKFMTAILRLSKAIADHGAGASDVAGTQAQIESVIGSLRNEGGDAALAYALPFARITAAGFYSLLADDDERALGQLEALIAESGKSTFLMLDIAYAGAARICQRKGLADKSLTYWRRALAQREITLARMLAYSSEQERLAFMEAHPFDEWVDELAQSGAGAEIARAVLSRKGVVLDSLLEDRRVAARSERPDLRAILEELRSAKAQVARVALATPFAGALPAGGDATRLATEGRRRVAELEVKLAAGVDGLGFARKSAGVTAEEISKSLPPGTALVEYVDGVVCGAVVLVPNRLPAWVPLPDPAAGRKESLFALYAKDVTGATDEQHLRETLLALRRMLWDPVAPHLPAGTEEIFIAPDGRLNTISFPCLLFDDGGFLAERVTLRHIGTGRDLLTETRSAGPTSPAEAVIFADAAFDSAPGFRGTDDGAGKPRLRGADVSDLSSLVLDRLPDSAAEAGAAKAILEKSGASVTVRLREDASEGRLRALASPAVLHLATHGFFLSSPKREGANLPGVTSMPSLAPFAATGSPASNPMDRAGLALAGAQTTLRAWGTGGAAAEPGDDGVVTAAEVAALRLEGTRLVVLSACSTGAGRSIAGEGVFGLRRGFALAGANQLLMTLWPVLDNSTADFMRDFYREWIATPDAALALARVQRRWLHDIRVRDGLQDAVMKAGPFVLTSRGRP